jgi:outer membrane immunogenic protein
MRKIAFTKLSVIGDALGAIVLPAAVQAQDNAPKAEVTIGATAGIHDLGVDFDDGDISGFDIDDSGEIYGGFVAVDFPLDSNLFAGVEGAASLGSGPIDAEYGASARLGIRTSGGGKVYVRGGYQWVDLDVGNLIDDPAFDEDDFGLDTTVDDYLVGIGAEFPVSGVVLRANVDTIAFDTLRGTVGVGLKF